MREPEETPAVQDSEWGAPTGAPTLAQEYTVRPYDVLIIDLNKQRATRHPGADSRTAVRRSLCVAEHKESPTRLKKTRARHAARR
jgi:hypothetical protein